jgi:glycosyltransferase involved in cell wall biosynthesis
VDDGSKPEHKQEDYHLENMRLIHTYDYRPWTQGIARNTGVKHATGEYIFCTDIDHILSKEAILFCYDFKGDKVIFPRYLAVLDERGNLTQDTATLIEYGLDPARLETKRGLYASYHGNTYCMRRELFWELGGNDERHCLYGHHAASKKGEDSVMNTRYNHWALKNNGVCEVGPKIYMFTNGRYNRDGDPNPKGLFHRLSYEQPKS